MTPTKTGEARARLLTRSAELRADIQRELARNEREEYAMLADRLSDSGEHSVADLLVDVDLAEISRDIAEFREVEAALLRIAHGTYGVCIDCGETIARERLEVAPASARCYACQNAAEEKAPRAPRPKL